jgi:KDO2-lipid IV(A) lauroyltransferase
MHITGEEHLNAALRQGRGVIIVGAHKGPFDYLVQYLGIKGYDVTIPVEHLKDSRMLNLMLDLRRSHGLHFLPLTGSVPMRIIVQKLRENKIVSIVADRVIEGKGVEVNFFGAPAIMPIGPVKLAQRTGATLVCANCYRTTQGLASGHLLPLSLKLTDEQRTDTDSMMRAFIEQIEDSIHEHPEQWVTFTPIWLEDIKNGS